MATLEDRWLSLNEICEYLGVSSDTVYKLIKKHAMPAHRMGRLWKFKKDDVDIWIKAGGASKYTPKGIKPGIWGIEKT
jgi:excisionase family DNA binding protein